MLIIENFNQLVMRYMAWKAGRLTMSKIQERELKTAIMEAMDLQKVTPEKLSREAENKRRAIKWIMESK